MGESTNDAVKEARSVGEKIREGQEGTIEITFTRVNWGGGGDHGRASGTNNRNYHSKSDGSSGDREHAICKVQSVWRCMD